MAANTPDLALNRKLWAYRVGRPARQLHQIIRVHRDTPSSRTAGATMGILSNDASGAGQEWSNKEYYITDTPRDELVLVIGELIPEDLVPSQGTLRACATPREAPMFDPARHHVVATSPQARIVVIKLTNQKGHTYVLANKRDSLCHILPLPAASADQLVLYREWISGSSAQYRQRFNEWKHGILSYAGRYVEEHLERPAPAGAVANGQEGGHAPYFIDIEDDDDDKGEYDESGDDEGIAVGRNDNRGHEDEGQKAANRDKENVGAEAGEEHLDKEPPPAGLPASGPNSRPESDQPYTAPTTMTVPDRLRAIHQLGLRTAKQADDNKRLLERNKRELAEIKADVKTILRNFTNKRRRRR